MATTRIWAAALLLVLTGCSGEPAADGAGTASPSSSSGTQPSETAQAAELLFPDILTVKLTSTGQNTFDVAVTVSSPYDTPEQYADGWRVLAPDGTVLAEHTLAHDHANEQPFTRVQSAVTIPADVREVTVEGRDRRNGYGGRTIVVSVPR